MAVFDFNQIDNYVQDKSGSIPFFSLKDDGWYANVRFMYDAGENFQCNSVHNISTDPKKSKYVPCLRNLGDPLDVCPLCAKGNSPVAQFYLPLYVISITKVINGVAQTPEPINQAMLFQRGKTFQGAVQSAIRQSNGTPIVSNIFRIVRSGKPNDPGTSYLLEWVERDETTLAQLPERIEALGTYILPNITRDEMIAKYMNPSAQPQAQPQGIMPRTVSANTFGQNTVVQSGQISPQPPTMF